MSQAQENKGRILFGHFDIVILVLAIWIYFFLFYVNWPIWNDQAIFHVAAFRFLHGEIPYKDFILFHWPGSFILHAIAYLISGIDPFGLRFVDCSLLTILALSTSFILKSWNLPWNLRLTCIAPYIAVYFGQYYGQTAQREGMQLPLLVLALLPLFFYARPFRNLIWFLSGVLLAFGLLVKPTSIVFVGGVIAASALSGRFKSKEDRIGFLWALAGGTLIAVFFIAALKFLGGWEGFYEFALRYNAEAYSQSRDSFDNLFWKFSLFLFGQFPWTSPMFFCVVLFLLSGLFLTLKRRLPEQMRPFYFAAFLIGASLFQYYWQGKGWCYQLFPFQWTLCLLSAAALVYLQDQKIFRWNVAKVLFVGAPILAILWVGGSFLQYPARHELPGTQVGKFLKSKLKPGEFGLAVPFEAMVVQLGLETVPDFKFIEPSVIFQASSVDSVYKLIILENLERVFQDPRLRFLVSIRRRPTKAIPSPGDEFSLMFGSEGENPFRKEFSRLKGLLQANFQIASEYKTPEYSHDTYVIYERR